MNEMKFIKKILLIVMLIAFFMTGNSMMYQNMIFATTESDAETYPSLSDTVNADSLTYTLEDVENANSSLTQQGEWAEQNY